MGVSFDAEHFDNIFDFYAYNYKIDHKMKFFRPFLILIIIMFLFSIIMSFFS